MLVADILHSCSNERVAEAAVASIGGEFAFKLRRMARRCGTSVGDLAATIVRRFALEAGERDWRRVTLLMSGADLPLLCGLHAIIEGTLQKHCIAVQLTDSDPDGECSTLPWKAKSLSQRANCLAC